MIAKVSSNSLRPPGGRQTSPAFLPCLLLLLCFAFEPAALPAEPAQNQARDAATQATRGEASRAARAPGAFYEIVYADANIGASSGGHSALKFGRTIYHYQMYRDGIFRLVREDWADFRRLYNDRENRSLRLRTVRISQRKLSRLKDFFALRYLVQQAHLRYFKDLQHEREYWQALAAAPVAPRLPIPGYGMFARPASAEETKDTKKTKEAAGADNTKSETSARTADGARELRDLIAARTGRPLPELVEQRRAAIHLRIKTTLGENLALQRTRAAQAPVAESTGDSGDEAAALAREFDPDRLPRRPVLFSQSVREDLSELAALRVLEEARALHPEALFDAFAKHAPAEALQDFERAALAQYRAVIEDELLALLATPAAVPGADRGATLLLNLARHRAISLSLSQNRLRTLDPFPARRVRVTAAAIQRDRSLVHRMAATARRNLAATRSYVFSAQGALSETRYNRLEADAGRYFEIRRGAEEIGYSIRTTGSKAPMIPGSSHPAPLDFPHEILPDEWPAFTRAGGPARRWRLAQEREARYLERLRQGYDYHLIRKNCVTELLRGIAAGGGIPDGVQLEHRFNFIPFVAFDLFAPAKAAAVSDDVDPDLRRLPSYRKRRLARIREREGAIAAPRESFAGNSTIYTPRPRDTAFLLFTDDIFWARPLYGAANLAYGLATTGAGVFSAPFDRGERLQSGLRGALFSLPELVWFNIRKGSFDLPEDSQAAAPLTQP